MKSLRQRLLANRKGEGDDERQKKLREAMKEAKRKRRAYDKACKKTGGGHDAMTTAPAMDDNPDDGI